MLAPPPYVLDTNFFAETRLIYPDIFPSFWKKMEDAVLSNQIISVEQVKIEVENYEGEQEHLKKWLEKHKSILFKPHPSIEESTFIKKVLSKKLYESIFNNKKSLQGKEIADLWVIARAQVTGGTVVSAERPGTKDSRGNIQAPRMPDICKDYRIPYLLPKEFMKKNNWKF